LDTATNQCGITIRASKDNGLTWQTVDQYSVPGVRYDAFDIVVAGTDTNSLDVYLAGVNHNINTSSYVLFVDHYDGRTLSFTGSRYNHPNGTRAIYDLSLATDYKFSAVGATPYSVGLLYSTYSASYDSICFVLSTDGGATFGTNTNNSVAVTGGYFRKVSLAYGYSSSASNGRYFAAWEQLGTSVARTGHIYEARNTSQITSPFNTPVCLDSLSATMINLCRNPCIAVSETSTDNDSASVTAIVTVDRDYTGNGSDYDLLGFYNKRAHYTDYWYRLDVVNSSETDMYSNISYDPVNDNFLLTYLDSTNLKLPYLVNGLNLSTPNTWTTITPNYSNSTNLSVARPEVVINPVYTQVALAWTKNEGGKGRSYFDAEYLLSQAYHSTLVDSGCTGLAYNYNGHAYNTAGTYADTLTASNGLDSIVTLQLGFKTGVTATVSADQTICNNASATLTAGGGDFYNWSSGATTASVTVNPSSTATYIVTVTSSNGCADTATVTVTVNTCNGIAGTQADALNVYPNPFNDRINLDLISDREGTMYIHVYNVLGDEIYTADTHVISGNNYINIHNTNKWANGIYILKAEMGSISTTVRLVKN
jgi:hypothetical protein